ncbi:acyltransferase [Neolewinella antarctica]|uniref:UDP-2-acetamido-3-amino-2,3-dideoxy-glucuronate N-acetyltransferase n=1 Tax=Neolewinella antarctica TaxID=442734 RepID=A0ABX0XBY1_9BACT|nr:acyltransferase [Neolewinella antarctica]NJC26464.1 UDP-2-acetamido-3-amino-2,3-dideoxy-glucuronate N-acetyltransferase [Neolewinella antarctica]
MPVFIHPTAVVDEGARIGDGTKIWHFCHLSSGSQLGAKCNLGQNVYVASGVVLGRNCKVQNNVSLYTGVTCADDVFIGPSAVFTNVKNPRAAVNRRGEYAATKLERGVTIGANAVIVCGVTLAAYAMVGAGSVVTKDVAAYSLVVGNPARHVGWVSKAGVRLDFDAEGRAFCADAGVGYFLDERGCWEEG